MTYEQIIKKVGRMIDKKIYYYDETNTKTYIDEDDIVSIKIAFNSDITGTIMKKAELVVKSEIEANNGIYAEIKATYGNNNATKEYGPYYIESKEYSADTKEYTYYCYDEFLNTMVEYSPITITYPTTIQDFYDTLVETLGYTSSVSLVNGSLQMTKDIYEGINYSYRSVIDDIAQANGILLEIEDDEIKEATYGEESDAVTIDDDILKNSNIAFGEHFGAINTLVLARSGDSDKIYYPETLPDNPLEYKISDNQLMNENNRNTFMPGIYSKINGIEFDLFDTELIGHGGFAPLQKVYFETGDNTYESYIFNAELNFTDGYSETIYTETPAGSQSDYLTMDTTDERINQAYIIVNKQTQRIDALVTQIEDLNIPDLGNYATKEYADNLVVTAKEGLANTISITGGANLVRNSIAAFGDEYWEDTPHTYYTDSDVISKSGQNSCWMLNNGTAEQTITVKNGKYALSFIYKKLIELANCKITINDYEIELSEETYTDKEYIFDVINNTIVIKLTSDTDSSCLLLNLMINKGDSKLPYSYNSNETISDTVQIGKGIQIKSSGSDTMFDAQADGIRIYSTKTNEIVTEFTSKGIETDYINAKDGIISKIMYKDIGNQTFITKVGD